MTSRTVVLERVYMYMCSVLTFVLSTFGICFDYFCERENTDFDWLLDMRGRLLVDLKFSKLS